METPEQYIKAHKRHILQRITQDAVHERTPELLERLAEIGAGTYLVNSGFIANEPLGELPYYSLHLSEFQVHFAGSVIFVLLHHPVKELWLNLHSQSINEVCGVLQHFGLSPLMRVVQETDFNRKAGVLAWYT